MSRVPYVRAVEWGRPQTECWKHSPGPDPESNPVDWRAVVNSTSSTHVDRDMNLGLAAVGLWHKLHANLGDEFDEADILTVHPDPNAWGPFNELHDLSEPFNELVAIGYAQVDDGRVYLYSTIEYD